MLTLSLLSAVGFVGSSPCLKYDQCMVNNKFGDRLRALRLNARISPDDLAETVGITTKTITRIEKGERGTIKRSWNRVFAGMLILCTDDDALSNSGIKSTHVNLKRMMYHFRQMRKEVPWGRLHNLGFSRQDLRNVG